MEGRLRRAEEFGKSRLEFDGAPISPLKPFVLLPQRSFDDRLPRDSTATSGQNCKTWNGCVGPNPAALRQKRLQTEQHGP